MKCWVCKRQARGYGHSDGRFQPVDPRHYPIDWVFCSRRCQDAFHALYGNWRRVKEGRLSPTEVDMIDPTDVERGAMKKCLKAFGEAAGEIGFTKPLSDYSEAEALQVIDAIVTCYSDAMVDHHERHKYPPIKGLPATPDPFGFSDLEDKAFWEKKP